MFTRTNIFFKSEEDKKIYYEELNINVETKNKSLSADLDFLSPAKFKKFYDYSEDFFALADEDSLYLISKSFEKTINIKDMYMLGAFKDKDGVPYQLEDYARIFQGIESEELKFTSFYEGLAMVSFERDKAYFINKEGMVLFSGYPEIFKEGYSYDSVDEDGDVCFKDKDGDRILIQKKFNRKHPGIKIVEFDRFFCNGLLKVKLSFGGRKYQEGIEEIESFGVTVDDENKIFYAYIDIFANIIIVLDCLFTSEFMDGIAYLKDFNGKYGLIDLEGKYISDKRFDEVHSKFINGLALVSVDKQKVIINSSGEEVKYSFIDESTSIEEIVSFLKNGYIFKSFHFFNKILKMFGEIEEFKIVEHITNFKNGIALARKRKKYFIANKDLKRISEKFWDFKNVLYNEKMDERFVYVKEDFIGISKINLDKRSTNILPSIVSKEKIKVMLDGNLILKQAEIKEFFGEYYFTMNDFMSIFSISDVEKKEIESEMKFRYKKYEIEYIFKSKYKRHNYLKINGIEKKYGDLYRRYGYILIEDFLYELGVSVSYNKVAKIIVINSKSKY